MTLPTKNLSLTLACAVLLAAFVAMWVTDIDSPTQEQANMETLR